MNFKKILRKYAGIISENLLRIFPPYLIPFSEKILEQFYVAKLRKQQFQTVLDYCSKLSEKSFLPEKLKKVSSDYFCKASLDNNPDRNVLDKLAVRYQTKTAESLENLNKNNRPAAVKSFKDALINTGISYSAEKNLSAAFSMLAGEIQNVSDKFENNIISKEEQFFSAPKIILSGMNWSGTGALYDYFREFSCVKALPFEQRLWKESDYSLIWGYNNLDNLNDKELSEYLLRLLLIPAAGLAMPRNWQDVFGSHVGFEYIRNDKSGLYAAAVGEFISKILELKKRHQLNKTSFLNRSVELTDKVLNNVSGNFKSHIMPDNSVHLSDIGTFRFFSNAYLLCVFRDPRSNYAARFHENVRFNRDPKAYVKYYRETRESFIRKKEELASLSDRIIEIQFEEFILSEELRNNLSKKIGLDFTDWKKHRYFKPYVSEKNVLNYKKFHDQKIIDLIGNSLKEYCL